MTAHLAQRALALMPSSRWRYNGRVVELDGWPLLVWRTTPAGRDLLGGDVHLRPVGMRRRQQSHGAQPARLAVFLRYARPCD